MKRVVPAPVRRQLRRVPEQLEPHNRAILLRSPLATAAVAYNSLTLTREGRHRPVGVERLSAISVINLRERPDRMAEFLEGMRRLGIDGVRRVEGIKSQNGLLGCTRAHASCVA